MKNKGFMIILAAMLVFSALFSNNIAAASEIEVEEISDEDDGLGYLGDMPIYYQNDYHDVAFGNSTLAEQGNLVTCLAMLESYYTSQNITPDIFVEKHSDDCLNGTEGLNSSSISDYAKLFDVELTEANFDYSEALEHIRRYQSKVLLKIPHNSILGTGTSYIILAGIKDNGFVVRDPNKNNIKDYAYFDGEDYIYDAYLVAVAAGKSSVMYIME